MKRIFDAVIGVGTRVLKTIVLSYFDVRCEGLAHIPARGPAIVAGNHPGQLDGLLLYLVAARPLRFIAHRILFRHLLIAWIMEGLGYLCADRRGSVRGALAALERGGVIVVFPEGEVWDGGRMLEIHSGVAVLALRSGAPVIPMGIAGSGRALPLGSYLPRPCRVAYRLEPPVYYPRSEATEFATEDLLPVLVDLRSRILDAERRAEALRRRLPARGPTRWARIVASGLLLLPLVAALTALSPDPRPPLDRT